MSLSPDYIDQFRNIIQSEDVLHIREFLNNQNISDVAELIYDCRLSTSPSPRD